MAGGDAGVAAGARAVTQVHGGDQQRTREGFGCCQAEGGAAADGSRVEASAMGRPGMKRSGRQAAILRPRQSPEDFPSVLASIQKERRAAGAEDFPEQQLYLRLERPREPGF